MVSVLILEMLLLTQPCLLLVHVISRTIDHYTLSWFKKHPFVEKVLQNSVTEKDLSCGILSQKIVQETQLS